MNEIIKTKFGNASINNGGYYTITTSREGNHGKLLHVCIWEDHYGKPVPEGYDIHHVNLDKLDNRIQNLQCVERSLHLKFHKKGKNNPNYGKKYSEKECIELSKLKNTTGYFRVFLHKDKKCKQGFIYEYRYPIENGKRKSIHRVNLDDLEKEVKKRGLPWHKIEEI